MQIESKFAHLAWDEIPVTVYDDGNTLKQADVRYRYTGALEGESTLRYQCLYTPDGAVPFVGIERFVGRLNGLEGSIFWLNNGAWRDGAAIGGGEILSATGQLAGLRGTVRFHAVHQPENTILLDVTFPETPPAA
jgi:hypothetical protein